MPRLDPNVPYYDRKSKGSADAWLQKFEDVCRPLYGYDGNRPVRIAILDTGIDWSLIKGQALQERVKDKKSFLVEDDGKDDDSAAPDASRAAHDEADDRHGTNIAGLVLRLAPWAHAIYHAIDTWKVHIISISLGFQSPHECVEVAIRYASEKGAIMFASASNDGANRPMDDRAPFPASMSEVICINSSDGQGNPSDFNPPPGDDDFNFMTLGESVLTIPGLATGDADERHTGTSFATPVAAAIAAVFIEFFNQRPLRLQKHLVEEVITQDGISKLFVGMSEPVNGFRYLRPWDLMFCQRHSEVPKCRKGAAEKVQAAMACRLPTPASAIPNLPHVPGAEFDSHSHEDGVGQTQHDAWTHFQEGTEGLCLKGTRTQILHDIAKWADSPHGQLLGWLTGRAGSGKSAIARTACLELRSQRRLGASFFFSRKYRRRHEATDFVTSIAYQLAKSQPRVARAIAAAIAADPDLAGREKNRQMQWRELVVTPLASLRSNVVIVIDALDESTQADRVLPLFADLKPLQAKVRILVTSRLGTLIEGALHPSLPAPCRFDLDLESLAESTSKDISLFIRSDLAPLKETIEGQGPGDTSSYDTVVEKVATKSAGLFIYAKTACRYIRGTDVSWDSRQSTDAQERLAEVLVDKQFEGIDGLYTEILSRATTGRNQKEVAQQLHQVLELIMILANPVPEQAFKKLCPADIKPSLIKDRLDSLHSVLVVRRTPSDTVEVFHESFRTFILEHASSDFKVDESGAHERLFGRLMLLISQKSLKMDICNLRDPAAAVEETDQQKINNHLPPEIQYACRYWVSHLEQVDQTRHRNMGLVDAGQVHHFLEKHFLHWLEALGLMGSVGTGIYAMKKLKKMLSDTAGAEQLLILAHDALRFVQHHRWLLKTYPLQVYTSALIFSPSSSKVKQLFQGTSLHCVAVPEILKQGWGRDLRISDPVDLVACSPSSLIVATTDGNETVSIWDMVTGERLSRFYHESVRCLVFSPDAKMLVSAGGTMQRLDRDRSEGQSPNTRPYLIKIWDLDKEHATSLPGYTSPITSIVLSQDSMRLVSVAEDGIFAVWNMCSRVCEATIQLPSTCMKNEARHFLRRLDPIHGPIWGPNGGHIQPHETKGPLVRFSNDPELLVVASYYFGVRSWSSRHDHWKTILEGGHFEFDNDCFSPDAKTFAVYSHCCVDIYDASAGKLLQSLRHEAPVTRVVYSSSGLVATETAIDRRSEYIIHIWDIERGKRLWKLRNSDVCGALVFSPDSTMLASTQGTGTFKIWDMATGKCRQRLGNALGSRPSSMTFSFDSEMLIMRLRHKQIQIWDLTSPDRLPPRGVRSRLVDSISFGLASMAAGRIVRRQEFEKDGEMQQVIPSRYSIATITFSQDPKVLVSVTTDKYLAGRRTETRNPVSLFSDSLCPGATSPESREFGLTACGTWIMRDSKRWVWLPPTHRASCLAVQESKTVGKTSTESTPAAMSRLAVGCFSGTILILSPPGQGDDVDSRFLARTIV